MFAVAAWKLENSMYARRAIATNSKRAVLKIGKRKLVLDKRGCCLCRIIGVKKLQMT
jgi:hypothetical protein